MTSRIVVRLAIAAALSSFIGPAAAVSITETAVTTAGSEPTGVARGSDGSIWFTQQAASKIGRLNPATGAITGEFPTDTPDAGPSGIVATASGFLWFTEENVDRIGRIDSSGNIDEFGAGVITSGSRPNAIAVGPDGFLYFTEFSGGKLGRVDPATNSVTEIGGVTLSGPAGIVTGPDNRLWITESGSNNITRYDPITGNLTRFPLPAGTPPQPTGITLGPDNFIWFTEPGRDRVGKIDPFNTNPITEYSSGITFGSRPNYIAVGSDDNLWYTTQSGGRIARVIPDDGSVLEFSSGITANSVLRGIAGDAVTGALFYASGNANAIGKVVNLTTIPPIIRFESTNFKVSEFCEEATIKVIREGDTGTAVSVDFATSDDSATVGDDDYESASGTLNFGVGVASQTFTVEINNSGGVEEVEDVRLSLLNAAGGAEISTPTANLQIFDSTRLDDEGRGDTCDKSSRGGCALGKGSRLDPTLPMMLMLAAGVTVVRRAASRRETP
ncbi:MAG: Calx-beta domain-containing protein [Burkholderiales bacterium]